MAIRRVGNATAFWNNVSAGAGTLSNKVHVARDITQVTIYIKNGTTGSTFDVMASHFGSLTPEGNEANYGSPPADAAFYPITYTNIPMSFTLLASATIAVIIPDFSPGWICLRSSATSAPTTAGWEGTGE